jgi:hypothetical protein
MATVPESIGALSPSGACQRRSRSGRDEHAGDASDSPVGGELDDIGPGRRLPRVAAFLGPGEPKTTSEQSRGAGLPDPEAGQGLVGRRDQVDECGTPDDAIRHLVVSVDAVLRPALLEQRKGAIRFVPGSLIQVVGVSGSKHPSLLGSRSRPGLYREGLLVFYGKVSIYLRIMAGTLHPAPRIVTGSRSNQNSRLGPASPLTSAFSTAF